MENIQKAYFQYDFQINEIINKCLSQVKSISETMALFYHASLNYHADPIPCLQTDSLPLTIADTNNIKDTAAIKSQALEWLFKKGVEDMIIGITESLMEAYKFVRILSLAKSTKVFQVTELKQVQEQLAKKIAVIGTDAQKKSFPDLIATIETEIGGPLPLRKEILSINAIRNCLVHRNGIVSALDIKKDPSGMLALHYMELVTYFKEDTEMKEMKWEHKKNGIVTNQISLVPRPKTLTFPLNSRVVLDQNICNSLIFTCVQFIHQLHPEVLPVPVQNTKHDR